MANEIKLAEQNLLEGIGRISNAFGLNRFIIQLYFHLYLKSTPLTLDDICTELGVSKGNVSINIRELENWGAVKRIWVKGSRKDYFMAESNITKVAVDRIRSMSEKRLNEVEGVLASAYTIIEQANSSDPEEIKSSKEFRAKLDKVKNLQVQAKSVFNLLNSGIVKGLIERSIKSTKKEQATIS